MNILRQWLLTATKISARFLAVPPGTLRWPQEIHDRKDLRDDGRLEINALFVFGKTNCAGRTRIRNIHQWVPAAVSVQIFV